MTPVTSVQMRVRRSKVVAWQPWRCGVDLGGLAKWSSVSPQLGARGPSPFVGGDVAQACGSAWRANREHGVRLSTGPLVSWLDLTKL